jgi:CubicO group peptidase (beta-lactamase class C family)
MKVTKACAALLIALLLVSVSLARNPGGEWQQYRTPEEAGWSSRGLAEAKAFYDEIGAAAFLVVYDGRVLVSWGDPVRRFMCHSVRKSFLSALYGTHVEDGTIDIDKKLADLGIDDKYPLTETEKQARVRDLLRARSGVYHPAAYETQGMKKRRPERGSHLPGTFWYYNNWDFNTLCTILEQETGTDVFEDFQRRIALPLQMQDFRLIDGYHHYEPEQSVHPAYPFKMSARDMARFGLLFLSGGGWDGKQVISGDWVRESTDSYSDVANGVGYGYMWWTRDLPVLGRSYYAQGYGGHVIGVLPDHNLVFVQRVDTYTGNSVPGNKTMDLVHLILDARSGDADPEPDLIGFEPPPKIYHSIRLDGVELEQYVKQYPSASLSIDIGMYEGGLLLRSSGLGNYRLFPLSSTEFFVEDIERYTIVEFEEGVPGRLTIHATEAVAELYETIVTGGIEQALALYRAIHEKDSRSHPFSEEELNSLGYELLGIGKVGEAVEILKLNVGAFPESFNVYDSLGEAYMAGGDYDLAIANYSKSLELNPENGNAEEKIDRIRELMHSR